MPAVIDKALDFINGMNTSAASPEPMDESTAKGILKYLKELGCPASVADITARGEREGWNPGFTQKLVGWAEKFAAGERVLIRDPEYFSLYMRQQLQELVNAKHV